MIYYILPSIFLTVIYFLLGLGVSRAISKWKNTEISTIFIFLWPMVLIVLGLCGDI